MALRIASRTASWAAPTVVLSASPRELWPPHTALKHQGLLYHWARKDMRVLWHADSEHVRLVRRGRRLPHEVEQLLVVRDRAADAVVQRRVAQARRVGEPLPDAPELAGRHPLRLAARSAVVRVGRGPRGTTPTGRVARS